MSSLVIFHDTDFDVTALWDKHAGFLVREQDKIVSRCADSETAVKRAKARVARNQREVVKAIALQPADRTDRQRDLIARATAATR